MQLGNGVGWLVVGAALASACGSDSNPAAPTQSVTRPLVPTEDFPAGTAILVVSGEGGQPVAGAKVTVGPVRQLEGVVKVELTTDGSGAVTLPEGFDEGVSVDIADPEFLLRKTRLRVLTGTRLSLWPTESPSGMTQEFVFDVVYHDSTGDTRHMMRIQPGTDTAYVVPSAPMREDFRSMRAINDAVSELNDIARGEIHFVVNARPPADGVSFDLVVLDELALDGALARARRRLSGWNIIGGTVEYDSLDTVRTSATHHELGHMFGLGHSGSRADVMYPYQRRAVETFSPRERVAMRLMLQRPAANQQPDNDRNVRSAQTFAPEWLSVVNCYEN